MSDPADKRIPVKLPDGTRVWFPEGTSREVMKAALEKRFPKTGKGIAGTIFENVVGSGEIDTPGERFGAAVNDTGKALFRGIGRGAMGLVTLPQTLGGFADAGMERVTGAPMQSALPDAGAMAMQSYNGTFTGRPETTAGEYAETVGEFLPGALLGGGVRQMIAAGMGSEAAGQATEGTKLEPWARVGGGILGGGAMARTENTISNILRTRDYISSAPTTQALRDAAKAKYVTGHGKGLKIKPAGTAILDGKLRALASEAGYITPTGRIAENTNLRQLFALLDDYQAGPVTTKQMQALRRQINSMAGSVEPEVSRMGVMMKREYDDFLAALTPEFRDANKLNAQAMRGEMMDKAEDLAVDRASQFSQSGMENALRTEYRQLSRDISKGKLKGLRPDQVEAIRNVSRATGATKLLRSIGKFAPRGPVSAMSHSLPAYVGFQLGGVPGAAVLGGATMGLGLLGQMGATQLQRGAQRYASAAMRQPVPMVPAPRVPFGGIQALPGGLIGR